MPVLDLFSERAINIFLGNEDHSRPNSCHYLSAGDAFHSILNYSNLPEKKADMVRIIIISDTHERHTKLQNFPKGDILIHCGDFRTKPEFRFPRFLFIFMRFLFFCPVLFRQHTVEVDVDVESPLSTVHDHCRQWSCFRNTNLVHQTAANTKPQHT